MRHCFAGTPPHTAAQTSGNRIKRLPEAIGKLSKLEMDTSGDQVMDYWEYYEDGVMQRSGKDTDGDGKIDQWGDL